MDNIPAADLILTDPPYALGLGSDTEVGRRVYARDENLVVEGYVDIPAAHYSEFTDRWVAAAQRALRAAGVLVVITGPQQSPIVHMAAMAAGLMYRNRIAAIRTFPLITRNKLAHAHYDVTVAVNPSKNGTRGETFNPPPQQVSKSGRAYPQDVWGAELVGRTTTRPGDARYRTTLPTPLVTNLMATYSNPGDLVVDPFSGSGTTAAVGAVTGRRVIAGDVNPAAIECGIAKVNASVATGQVRSGIAPDPLVGIAAAPPTPGHPSHSQQRATPTLF